MKLYIPVFNEYKGGPSTFLRNLNDYLINNRIRVKRNVFNANLVLVSPDFHPLVLKYLRKKNAAIIQRLDGLFYPSQHGPEFIELNRIAADVYDRYSDFVIFQSDYSRKQTFHLFHPIPEKKYTIITNGVNTNIFYPEKEKKSLPGTIRFITTGNFRKPAMIEPIVNALDSLDKNLSFELEIIGNITDNDLKPFFNRPYIRFRGSKERNEIASMLRTADIYIHSQLNDNCPNSVLEAISSGLPVVSFRSGAMAELCFFSEELLAYVSDDILQEYKDFHPEKLAEKICLCIDNYNEYREKALNYFNHYDFKETGKKYLEIFNKMNDLKKEKFRDTFLDNVNGWIQYSRFEISKLKTSF